jgi:uncharacterized protein (TIGR02270 family)
MATSVNSSAQYAEEAAALWFLHRVGVSGPHYSLADLVKLDCRVEAHVDGLRITGEEGWKQCEEQLVANGEGEVFASGVAACESANPALMGKVVSVVEKQPKLAYGLISSLGWAPFEQIQGHIQRLLQANNPVHQLVGIGAVAVHRWHPGPLLLQAVPLQEVRLDARALKAEGEFHDPSLEGEIRESLHAADAEDRFAGARSSRLLMVFGPSGSGVYVE